jgi:hypothetical protein
MALVIPPGTTERLCRALFVSVKGEGINELGLNSLNFKKREECFLAQSLNKRYDLR